MLSLRLRRFRLTPDITMRLMADTIMVNLALIAAMIFTTVILSARYHRTTPLGEIIDYFVNAYLSFAWGLTALSLVIFYASGFYTRGRFYRGHYKALIVFQAVSLAYITFFGVIYLGDMFFDWNNLPPKLSFAALVAWGLTATMLIVARLWATLWQVVINYEQGLTGGKSAANVDQPQRVLVIGGAGYIGSALLRKLLDRGHQVRLLDLLLFGKEPLGDMIEHENLEVIQADLRQVDKIVEAMRGMDAVIHLGAIVGDPACALDEKLTIEINLYATRTIAEVAKGSGIRRFIFASTCSVYGASDETLNEHSRLNPVSLYARSKIASERVLRQLASATFTPTLLRFGTVYGLSGRTRFDLVINLLTARALAENKIPVFGGEQWRPFVHVDDAAEAILKALLAPIDVVGNQVFNVGSDQQNYRIREVAEIIHRLVPAAAVQNMGLDGDARNYRVSFQKIQRELRFEPQWTVEMGVQQVIDAMQSGRVTDYRDPRYSNVKFLKESEEAAILMNNHRYSQWAEELLSDPMETEAVTDPPASPAHSLAPAPLPEKAHTER